MAAKQKKVTKRNKPVSNPQSSSSMGADEATASNPPKTSSASFEKSGW